MARLGRLNGYGENEVLFVHSTALSHWPASDGETKVPQRGRALNEQSSGTRAETRPRAFRRVDGLPWRLQSDFVVRPKGDSPMTL